MCARPLGLWKITEQAKSLVSVNEIATDECSPNWIIFIIFAKPTETFIEPPPPQARVLLVYYCDKFTGIVSENGWKK